ncbi:hypothetical protein H8356DRAFT_1423677 [Neocallimastix lanati (nom. inval.)]|nr:hypothetical protein H8356DRAFT_1423677 [Neocallimastix sp. JGI-2020a]
MKTLFVTDMNNVELSSDSVDSNKVYNINNNNNRNNIVNNTRVFNKRNTFNFVDVEMIRHGFYYYYKLNKVFSNDSENSNINIRDMNRSIGENRVNRVKYKDAADIFDLNYKKE